jgi:hypothetical protein
MMFRRLIFIVIIAAAATAHPQAQPSQPSAQHAETLVGIRSKLAQLRAELEMNRAVLAGGGLPADDQARLNARAAQIAAEIDALLAQERALTRK